MNIFFMVLTHSICQLFYCASVSGLYSASDSLWLFTCLFEQLPLCFLVLILYEVLFYEFWEPTVFFFIFALMSGIGLLLIKCNRRVEWCFCALDGILSMKNYPVKSNFFLQCSVVVSSHFGLVHIILIAYMQPNK